MPGSVHRVCGGWCMWVYRSCTTMCVVHGGHGVCMRYIWGMYGINRLYVGYMVYLGCLVLMDVVYLECCIRCVWGVWSVVYGEWCMSCVGYIWCCVHVWCVLHGVYRPEFKGRRLVLETLCPPQKWHIPILQSVCLCRLPETLAKVSGGRGASRTSYELTFTTYGHRLVRVSEASDSRRL